MSASQPSGHKIGQQVRSNDIGSLWTRVSTLVTAQSRRGLGGAAAPLSSHSKARDRTSAHGLAVSSLHSAVVYVGRRDLDAS